MENEVSHKIIFKLRKNENKKIALAEASLFNSYELFKSVDVNNHGRISAQDILLFLKFFNLFHHE